MTTNDQPRAGLVRPGDVCKSVGECPEIERHTSAPVGYLAWHEWAERMSKTHRQERCPACGFYAVWTPKKEKVSGSV